MQKFFKNHPEFVLIGSTVILFGILLVYFSWGITVLVYSLNKAISTRNSQQARIGFDLKGAEGLDLRGLVK